MDLIPLPPKAVPAADTVTPTPSLGARAHSAAATFEATAELLSVQLDSALASGAIAPLPAPQVSARGKPGYDHLIDALNRLPRPILALATVALFLVAAIAPTWFQDRMAALSAIPEPLWWLAGAVITMFFGSREAYYRRQPPPKP